MFTNREKYEPLSVSLGLRSNPNKKIQFAKLLYADGTARNIICFEEQETKHGELSEINLLGIDADDFFAKMDKIHDANLSDMEQHLKKLEKTDKYDPFDAFLRGCMASLLYQLKNKQREA